MLTDATGDISAEYILVDNDKCITLIKQKLRSCQVNLINPATQILLLQGMQRKMYFGGLYRGSDENKLIWFRNRFICFSDTISVYKKKLTLNNYDRGMLMEKKNKLLCRIENNHCMMQFVYVYYYLMFLKKQFFYVYHYLMF